VQSSREPSLPNISDAPLTSSIDGVTAVTLEPMGPEHLESTLRWLQDADLRTAIDSGGAPTAEEHAAYWERRFASANEEAYAVLSDGRHVGNCGLLLDERRRKAELWLYLGDPVVRGAGIGHTAARGLLERVFDGLRLNRASVRVLSTNPGALRFWRSLGFVEEGRLREDSGAADSIWLGLLRGEWEAAR
jgi:RimJ/RimL family protein N-acetyltransferase